MRLRRFRTRRFNCFSTCPLPALSTIHPYRAAYGRVDPVTGCGGAKRRHSMKAVILAGGTGSRLHPLTRITNKHLLPVYDKPMIFYPIEALVSAGIDEIMVVTGGNHAGEFLPLLGNGTEFGLHRLQFS